MALKYQEIVRDIRSSIMDGTLEPGALLPSTPVLCQEYGVSKITVKRAMDELVADGLVTRRRGSGTFVRAQFAQGEQAVTSADVHVFSPARPDTNVAGALHLADDEFCYYLARTCYRDGIPSWVEYAFLPIAIASGLRRRHAEGDLFYHLERDLDVYVARTQVLVRAVLPQVHEAAWLGTDTATPLISVREVSFTDDGRAVAYVTRLHAPGYVFVSVSKR